MTSQTSGTLPFPCHQDVLIRSQGLPGLCGLCLRSRKAGGGDGGESWEPRGKWNVPASHPPGDAFCRSSECCTWKACRRITELRGFNSIPDSGSPWSVRGVLPPCCGRGWPVCLFLRVLLGMCRCPARVWVMPALYLYPRVSVSRCLALVIASVNIGLINQSVSRVKNHRVWLFFVVLLMSQSCFLSQSCIYSGGRMDSHLLAESLQRGTVACLFCQSQQLRTQLETQALRASPVAFQGLH